MNCTLAIVLLLPTCLVTLWIQRRNPIVENKTTSASSARLKEEVGTIGPKHWWYSKTENRPLSHEQKNKLREFKETPAGKNQVTENKNRIGQGGNWIGRGKVLKKNKDKDSCAVSILNKHAQQIIAKLGKIGEKEICLVWKMDDMAIIFTCWFNTYYQGS